MTALAVETRTPQQIRDELREGLHRLHEAHINGHVDTSHITATIRDWRPDLSTIGCWCLWEDIADALQRLDHIRSDMFDPADGDRELLEASADTQLEYDIDRLLGIRP